MSSIRSILEEVAQMGAEYANFGSPFNTEEDNIAGAEALYQSTIDQALKEIEQTIEKAKPEITKDMTISYGNVKWVSVGLFETYQSNLKKLLK